jgi:hypothetical protein
MKYFRSFDIPVLEEIQEESVKYLNSINTTDLRGLAVKLNDFPILGNYLSSLTKTPINSNNGLKFYITPPYSEIFPYIGIELSPIVLHIPIQNTKGTKLYYCSTDKTNMKYTPSNFLGIGASYAAIDLSLVEKTDSTELLTPYFADVSKLHGFLNPTDKTMIFLTVRFNSFSTNINNPFNE